MYVANLLKDSTQIESLHIIDAGVADNGMTELSNGLSQCPSLIDLDISHNIFGPEGLSAVLNAMLHTMSIQKFALHGLKIELEQA